MIPHKIGVFMVEIPPSSAMNLLQNYLKNLPDGPIVGNINLVDLLHACWDDFIGITPIKCWLSQMEDIKWSAPVLSFNIEREIGSPDGSIRTVHEQWAFNINTQIADSRLLTDEELTQIEINRKISKAKPVYIQKRRRYYKLDRKSVV